MRKLSRAEQIRLEYWGASGVVPPSAQEEINNMEKDQPLSRNDESKKQQQEFEAYLRSLDREALEECAIMLSRDATRLRRELDDERGVIR